ncbi:MAG: neutral zinc metallopeptidase [Variibacter sp.]
MRWDDFRRSDNVEDRRGMGGIPGGAGGLGIGTVLVLGLVGWALGIDPRLLISGAEILSGSGQQQTQQTGRSGAPKDQTGDFVAAIAGDTEDRWRVIFQNAGQSYTPPQVVIFDGVTSSGCGTAQSAMGPFYCPLDRKIYLDTSFFRDLETRFQGCQGKACRFSQAYVISHEVGHHVQNLLGILPKAQQAQRQVGDQAEANQIQVRIELQADCFAGVWANQAQQKWNFIEPGDVEAAMQTASAIGDDRLQKRSQGRVVPDAFTHGSSAQRARWFKAGLRDGKVSSCDTFKAAQL